MTVHIAIRRAYRLVSGGIEGLTSEEYSQVRNALGSKMESLIPQQVEDGWQNFQVEGANIIVFAFVTSIFDTAKSQIPIPDSANRIGFTTLIFRNDWLDLGELGHDVLAPLSVNDEAWEISEEVLGKTFKANLFLKGTITVD